MKQKPYGFYEAARCAVDSALCKLIFGVLTEKSIRVVSLAAVARKTQERINADKKKTVFRMLLFRLPGGGD